MSLPCLKSPCCENFCLKSGGITSPLPQYFSNLNLYVKPSVSGFMSTSQQNLTFNSTTNSYEPIWEWRGFVRTFSGNGNTLPVRLIQSTPFHMGNIWFIQVRNWINSTSPIIINNDYLILAFKSMSGQDCFTEFPSGDFYFNDENSVASATPWAGVTIYQPGNDTLTFESGLVNTLIATESRNKMNLSPGYCTFIYA